MIFTYHQVELLISCTDLANLDLFSKTDPMCVLFVKQFGQWKEYGRTEAVLDTLHPKVYPRGGTPIHWVVSDVPPKRVGFCRFCTPDGWPIWNRKLSAPGGCQFLNFENPMKTKGESEIWPFKVCNKFSGNCDLELKQNHYFQQFSN